MHTIDATGNVHDRAGRFAGTLQQEADPAEVLGAPGEPERSVDEARCSCARNLDGSTTTLLCPVHAKIDPCLTMSHVTGRRRKGTIRNGRCTNCGHQS